MMPWFVSGLIPPGATVAIADSEDGTPEEVLARGYDVVLHLSEHELVEHPVLLRVVWRDGLVPGCKPPAPMWIRWTGAGFVIVDEAEAA